MNMSKTNYREMSNRPVDADNKNTVVNETVETEVEETVAVKTEEVMPETVMGTVIKCVQLNIRKDPDIKSDIACVISEGSKVVIRSETLPDEWFSVTTSSGVEGFCMSKYISIEQ
jgi:uncharacterized protein YgiM (DUF1202 family)